MRRCTKISKFKRHVKCQPTGTPTARRYGMRHFLAFCVPGIQASNVLCHARRSLCGHTFCDSITEVGVSLCSYCDLKASSTTNAFQCTRSEAFLWQKAKQQCSQILEINGEHGSGVGWEWVGGLELAVDCQAVSLFVLHQVSVVVDNLSSMKWIPIN